jgi:hypothetical protein
MGPTVALADDADSHHPRTQLGLDHGGSGGSYRGGGPNLIDQGKVLALGRTGEGRT